MRNVGVGNDHLAAIRLQEPHDMPERDRFPDSASSDDGQRLAGIDIEADVLQDWAAEGLVDVSKLDVVRIFVTRD